MDWSFYCLTYRSVVKRLRMQKRFHTLGMQVKFWEGSHAWDPECAPDPHEWQHAQRNQNWDPHAWSVLHGHLFVMHDFLKNQTQEYLCVMEDDIQIRRDFPYEIPVIQAQFQKMNLDVCMLGYLTPFVLTSIHTEYACKTTPYVYMEYPDNVYGTQMYVMRRSHVQSLVHTHGLYSTWRSKALSEQRIQPADWIITKQGVRACVYPLMAVEESGGGAAYGDTEQTQFHALCHETNYDKHLYV